jgi:hypothetical protein
MRCKNLFVAIKKITKNNMDKQSERKKYALVKVNEFKSNYQNFEVSNLPPATFPAKLKNVKLTDKEMAQLPLHPIILSAICGTLFGDSSIAIHTGYGNARIQYRHSTRQTEWFMWKTFFIFGEFVNDTSVLIQEPDGFQKAAPVKQDEILGKWKVATKVDEKLTKLYKIICPKKHKQIQRFWLNHMNNYFLMTLWLDDGGLVGHRQGIISCNNTPLDQAEILASYICTVWEIQCKVVKVPSKKTATLSDPIQIVISDLENLKKYLRIIAPIIPVKSMLYKICLEPIESSCLQRWTSELKTLVRQDWHADIDQIYIDYKTAKRLKLSEEDIVQ